MLRAAFRQSRQFQKGQLAIRPAVLVRNRFLLFYRRRRINPRHLKFSLCQCSRLVKHYCMDTGKRLQIVASLYQNSISRCGSDAGEETHGYGDHKSTGTGDYQKRTGSADSFIPALPQKKRRQNRQQYGSDHYRRSIISGKPGNEVFHRRFFAAGIFHQFQDPGHRGIVKFLCDLYTQKTTSIDAAADHLVSGFCPSWNRFPCKR